jgi:formate dehydrogenase subunit delta
MANQIASNLGARVHPDTAAERVADHIRRFWTRDMCAQLLQYLHAGGEGLAPAVVLALTAMTQEDIA